MKNVCTRIGSLFAPTLFLATTTTLRAQWFDQGPVLSVTEENDTVMQTDRYYTQGVKFSYLHSDNHVPGFIQSFADVIPAFGYSVKATRIGGQVAQEIYTPSDIHTNVFLPNDRPYAGWLYTSLVLQRKGLTDSGHPVLENFQIDLGVIGPDSLADRAQSFAHGDSDQVIQAWKNQVNEEFGFNLKYQRSMIFSLGKEDDHRHFDFIPHAGFSLGNIDTSLHLGGLVRLGLNLPDDFGPQTLRSLTPAEGGRSPSRTAGCYGVYTFLSADGMAVGYNATLDGDAFRDSPHVTHEPLVGEFTGGVAFVSPYVELDLAGIYRTHEFTAQNERTAYCSALLKFKL